MNKAAILPVVDSPGGSGTAISGSGGTGESSTKKELEQRIEDWKKRISSLYQTIEGWLTNQDGLRIERTPSVTMYEEIMHRNHINSQKLDALDIRKGNHIVATVKPIGLWIIGVNGRVDILTKQGATIVVDKAERFKEPNWIAYDTNHRIDGAPLNKQLFMKLIQD